MGKFYVDQILDGTALKRSVVEARSDLDAAKTAGSVTAPLGREPTVGLWVRVTHAASGWTSWFWILD